MLPPTIKTQVELFAIGRSLAALDIEGFLAELQRSEDHMAKAGFHDMAAQSRETMTALREFATAGKTMAEAFKKMNAATGSIPGRPLSGSVLK